MESLIIIFLLLGPLLDVSAFYNLPVNNIVRGLYLLLVILLIFKNKNKQSIKLLLILLIFSVAEVLFQKFYLSFTYMETISNTLKFLYLPVSIIYFKDLTLKKYNKEKILSIIIFTYLGIYLLSYILGIGANVYLETDGKSGFRGLFTSINEFSAIIVGLLPIVSNYLKEKKNYLLLVLLFIFAILCSLLIGTKVLLGGIIVVLVYLLYQERNKFLNLELSKKIIIIVASLVLIIIALYLFTKTRTYHNMWIQQSFFKTNNIFDFINKVIFNDRVSFLVDNFNYFKASNIFNYLLGIGLSNSAIKMVEIDIFDILFRYGIIGFSIFAYIFSKLSFKKLSNIEKFSLILFVLISLTSGHVLLYPNVCIYIALLTLKNK